MATREFGDKAMNRFILMAPHIAVAVALGYLTSRWLGFSFWICFGVTSAAMMVNGWLAGFEDDMAGGFNSARPSRKEPYF